VGSIPAVPSAQLEQSSQRREARPAASVPSRLLRARPCQTCKSTGEAARFLFSPRNPAWTARIWRRGPALRLRHPPVLTRRLASGHGRLPPPAARWRRRGGTGERLREPDGRLDPRDRPGSRSRAGANRAGCPVQRPRGCLRRARSPPGRPETRQYCGTSERWSLRHLHSQRAADVDDVLPVRPARIQVLVPVKLAGRTRVSWPGVGKLPGELSRNSLRVGAAPI
jgi:hypothetical protein